MLGREILRFKLLHFILIFLALFGVGFFLIFSANANAFFEITIQPVSGQINMGSLSEQAEQQMDVGAQYAGYGEEKIDPRAVVMRVIMIILTFLGVVFVYLIVLSGYWLVTSHGEEEKITKARKTIQGAIIGLIIVLLSYSIAYFVGKRIEGAAGIGSNSPQFYYEE